MLRSFRLFDEILDGARDFITTSKASKDKSTIEMLEKMSLGEVFDKVWTQKIEGASSEAGPFLSFWHRVLTFSHLAQVTLVMLCS